MQKSIDKLNAICSKKHLMAFFTNFSKSLEYILNPVHQNKNTFPQNLLMMHQCDKLLCYQ